MQDLYLTVMDYEEQSLDPTDMIGGQLLPLRSNRRQDVEGARYNLVEHFDEVLAHARLRRRHPPSGHPGPVGHTHRAHVHP